MEKILIAVAIMAVSIYFYRKTTRNSQITYLKNYRFHPLLRKKLLARYPHLNDDQVSLVLETLRDYFAICHQSGKRMVSMPSQVVDVAWHEFILYTRSYKEFCAHTLGRFLHHTPTEAMKTPTLAQEGIKHAWKIACSHEKIDPQKPDRLPMIFAIDALLNIEDGYRYLLDCTDPASPMYGNGYCASDIGCSSGCSGDTGGDCESGGCGGD